MLTYFLIFLAAAMFGKAVHAYLQDRYWVIGWPFKSLEVWENWGILSILCAIVALVSVFGP